jgi:outer membrane protein insertion porin family
MPAFPESVPVPLMRSVLMSSCLAAVVPMAIAVEADVVADVVVEGTERMHPDRVLNRLKTQVGQPVSQIVINDDVRTIEEMGAFANTTKSIERIEGGGIRVIFRVRELPYVGQVRLDGVGYFARQSIEKVITVKAGGYLNPLLVESDRRAILRDLRGKNYLNAQVRAITSVDDTTGIGSIVYAIDLGEQVKVARTRFEGLPPGAFKYFIDQELINRPGAKFEPEMLDLHDLTALRRHLVDLGYLDTVITKHMVEFFDEVPAFEERARHGPKLIPEGRRDNRVVISYWVDAGTRYRLGDVRFVGNTIVSEEQLRVAFALPKGEWFERREIELGKRDSLSLVRNRGYARAVLIEDPVADTTTHTVDLTLQMREGDKYALGRIDIDGNVKTNDAVIRRGLRLLPGDLWSDAKRDLSRRQILREGVFANDPRRPLRIEPLFETTKPHPAGDGLKEVDALVEVTEDRTGSFNFNIGFASSVGIIGQVSFVERNFDLWSLLRGQGWRGAAHRLEASASWSEDRTSLLLGWTNRHLMDSPYLFGMSFQRSDSSQLDWDEIRLATTARFGRNFLDNDLRLGLSYTYTDLKIEDIDADASNDALDGAGKYWINTFRTTQEYNQLDHPVFPTAGWRLELSQALNGGVGSLSAADEYYRLDNEFDGFLPLAASDLGGVTYFRLGQRLRFMGPVGDTEKVPFYDRLYGGGAAPRHRGFDRYDLGPTEINRNGLQARVGGNREWLTTGEFSFPLQGTNQGLRGVIFSDIGQVWGEGESFDIGDLRYAAGIGIRFPASFPIAFDLAYLIDAKDGEDRTQFHFTISGFNF